MKAATSRHRFDERRRFTGLGEQMGRLRLDSDANELTEIWRTEHVRRSADLAEGSPDDGFRIVETHLVDPVRSTLGWSVTGLAAEDERDITVELSLVRRDPDTLPHVVRVRGVTRVERTLDAPLDLLRLPVPLSPDDGTYAATVLVLPVRFVRPRTDDEVVSTRVVLRDTAGGEHLVDVGVVPGPDTDAGQSGSDWMELRVDALAVLPRTPLPGGGEAALLAGWGLAGLPPRAEVYVGGLLADPDLPEGDVVLRGGDGTLAGAGRLYVKGRRSFLEHDWRYSLQPDLPDPEPLARPAPVPLPGGGQAFPSHLLYVDVSEVEVHGFEDPFLREEALDGEDTTFRIRQLTQVRAVLQDPDSRGNPPREAALPPPVGAARLTTNVRAGDLPDRFPPEQADPCRDRCLFTENASTGEGYTGSGNLHVRVEVLAVLGPGQAVVAWSRDNAATVVPLRQNAAAAATRLLVDPDAAARFTAGDVVVVEDRLSRLDPGRGAHAAVLRRLRAVDTAEGVLELEADGHTLTTDPRPLTAGGGLPRAFRTADAAAVRRWDGADWLVPDTRYALSDGLSFAFSGGDPMVAEFWTFTARVVAADGASAGVVEQLTDAPVRGPVHLRAPIGRMEWTPAGRHLVDLRRQFLPLHEVRDRLVELGRRRLSPGAFTVVVGDGVTTFGDIDQDVAEGVTGDEAIQAAVDRLGVTGGTVYVRKGEYTLEHPVLVQGRSNVRILGDGDATTLTVTGAGGAFYLDWCGHGGAVSVEMLRLVEAPEEETPFGSAELVGEVATGSGLAAEASGGLGSAVPLTPADLLATAVAVPDLLDALGARLRLLPVFEGRAAASVVRTIAELRRLQRLHPGQPLEDVAPDQLAVLRGLPHGVVTVTDSAAVTLSRLHVVSREGGQAPLHAGVLLSGTLEDVAVRDCRVEAPSGVVAAPYGRYLLPAALVVRPRAGLAVRALSVSGNRITPLAGGAAREEHGVRVADGVLTGVTVDRNRVEGFAVGVAVEDRAEPHLGAPVDRTVVRQNAVVGATRTGISVTGDGVDVEANEVRLAPGRPASGRLRAGVRVAGAGCRVRDTWVSLPATPEAPQDPLAVEAGVLVGGGVDEAPVLSRPVYDVEVTGNRVEGAQAASAAIGVLVGGPQPAAQVRVSGNSLRSLGGAGVRAMGHLGPVRDVRIDGNTVEAVALASFAWTPDVVAAVGGLTSVDLAGAGTPRDVLERLLAPGAAQPRAALDAVLVWLEQATLRGGIVLGLVDGALVDGNRVADVGTRQEVAAPVPHARVQTAGIAAAGGSEVVLRDNTVERVRGALVRTPTGPVVAPVLRPAILDVLRRLEVAAPSTASGLDVHGSVVAMRDLVARYAAGDRAVRQQLGGRIYVAMDAVTAALAEQGTAGRRLAEELAGAVDAMRDAQGTADHTRAANLTRAVLSDAAALTAPSEEETQAWTVAARFDHSVLGDATAVVEAATAAAEAAPTLLTGLEELGLDVAGEAQAVIAAAGTGAEEERARQRLATTLGAVAEGRAKSVAFAQAIPPGGPTVRDTTVIEGTVRLTMAALEAPDVAEVADAVLARVQQGADALAATLEDAHRDLAARLRADVRALLAARGREQVARLSTTLADIQRFAADPSAGTTVRRPDVADQRARFGAELAILVADRLERDVADLDVDVDVEAVRGLKILQRGVTQLVNLVADSPAAVRERASAAAREVAAAIGDPNRREQHRAAARAALQRLKDEQARLSGVTVALAEPAAPAGPTPAAERLPALAMLLADLSDVTDPQARAEALTLLDSQVRRETEVLGYTTQERASLLSRVAAATSALGGGHDEDAVASLAGVVDELADRTARRDDAPADALALRALTGALARALAPRVEARDRLLAVQRWVSATAESLSPTLSQTVATASDLPGALGAVRGGLRSLLPLPPLVVRPLPVPERLDPQAADGVYAAGVAARLAVSGTHVRTARSGAVVASGADHPLAPVDDGAGVQLAVEGNRVVGAALAGFDLRPPGSSAVDVVDNEVTGCAGLAEAADRGTAGAVVSIVGRGELVVGQNRLRRNGDPRWGRVLHEVVLDWRGDVTVQNNTVRHTGAGEGGAGLLLLTDPVAPDLVRRLATEPALLVEPPPAPRPPLPGGGVLELPDVVRAGLGDRLGALQSGRTFGVGGFRIAALDTRPVVDRLLATPAAATDDVPAAATEAASFSGLDAPLLAHPLLEVLRRRPPRLVFPLPPARRAVHVVGNDVVAAGPALLVLCEGPNLASVTAVGNELESSGATGAVYLREVDTTVFGTNRCECLPGVNVVVVRGRRSVVTVTGNVVLGAQPPVPLPLPLPPIRPDLAGIGDLTLAVAVGPEASVTLPLDAAAMLEAIEAAGRTTFAARAQESEARFTRFSQREQVGADPRIRQLLASGAAGRLLQLAGGGAAPIALQPRIDLAALRRAVAAPEGGETPAAERAGTAQPEPAAEAAEPEVVELLVGTTNKILAARDLDGAAKLFGVATTTGMTTQQARAFVQVQLAATSGNTEAALAKGLSALTGIEAPVAAAAPAATTLLEDVVSLALRSKLVGAGVRPPVVPTRPLPPVADPRRHSLVVLGGARVGAVNNITTAGVHIHDAAQSVENNL